ncbi:hypothetical protein [Paraflavitalea speifideaquila]|uniref:DUF3108 domain-containing protein n=1 Tax=Paraflavitalea speifideaquila TaxID=3076558 RepID=UPI0028E9981B|nr:hypothetical protein [Paraflavitalea speifideiaquila]
MRTIHAAVLPLLLVLVAPMTQAGMRDTFLIKDVAGKLNPSERKYLQYTETKDGLIHFNAVLTRTIQKTTYQGKDAFLIIQMYQTAKGIDRDSSYCQPTNLEPLAYSSAIQSEQYQEQVLFANGIIENTITFKDSTRRFTKTNAHFYNGVMTDELIAVLPFEKQKQFVLKTVNPGMRYFEYTTQVEVEGKEMISIPGAEKYCAGSCGLPMELIIPSMVYCKRPPAVEKEIPI